jgi:geranyl-CoA carboxylase alpha subunit
VKRIDTVLIANRGEIALRIIRTVHAMGLRTVAVYSDADHDAPHVRAAEAAVRIGPAAPRDSYLSVPAILEAARATHADAIHPGYGFLAESADFAARCTAAGLTFIGPSAASMHALGDKAEAKRLLADSGVPFLPGYYGKDQSDATLLEAARDLGVPLMIKAAAGGGGRGMRIVEDLAAFPAALAAARSEALAAFGAGDVLLERALRGPRHIEVQVFGDAFGNVVYMGERDCSVQRRHQKLIEESPSPAVDPSLRVRLGETAVAVARAANYEGAGTVEFLMDSAGDFFFIETNARLQVEHPVTEAITGFDLVEWQIRIARGEPLPSRQDAIESHGHAIEARLCAEDANRGFLPQSGTLAYWAPPPRVRVEHALESGIVISPYYDSLLAKIIVHAATRDDARRELARALEETAALGVATNRDALIACLRDETFASGEATTAFFEARAAAGAFAVLPDPSAFALAAALAYARQMQRGAFGAWTAWSTSLEPTAAVRLAVAANPGGERTTVSVRAESPTHLRVGLGDLAATVEFDGRPTPDDGLVRLRIDDGPWETVAVAFIGERIDLARGAHTFAFVDATREPASAAGGADADGTLRSPMSARVVRVGVAAGDRVAAGTTAVVLESMKMEHVLTIPREATIEEVVTGAERQVAAGDVLVRYAAVAVNGR